LSQWGLACSSLGPFEQPAVKSSLWRFRIVGFIFTEQFNINNININIVNTAL
jgi:hypothetical protein